MYTCVTVYCMFANIYHAMKSTVKSNLILLIIINKIFINAT